jgi:uroporphyrinogen-III synthase
VTFLLRGVKKINGQTIAKSELITSSKDEAEGFASSFRDLGFEVTRLTLIDKTPDQVREMVLEDIARSLGSEFILGMEVSVTH